MSDDRETLRRAVIDALTEIAPEVDPAAIDEAAGLADQLELDSMDMLNLIVAIHERTGIEVPERDYGRLATLRGAVDYLAAIGGSSSTDR